MSGPSVSVIVAIRFLLETRAHSGCVRRSVPVQDTHLHASLQRRLEELEVEVAYGKRREAPGKVPKLSRADIVALTRETWLGLNHESLARVGYRQTGPTLPTSGDNDAEMYRDLLPFWKAMEGPKVREAHHPENN